MQNIQSTIPQASLPYTIPFFNLLTDTIIDRMGQIFHQASTQHRNIVVFYLELKEKYITPLQIQRLEKIDLNSAEGVFFISIVENVGKHLNFSEKNEKNRQLLEGFSLIEKEELTSPILAQQFIEIIALEHVSMAIDHLKQSKSSNLKRAYQEEEAKTSIEVMEEDHKQQDLVKEISLADDLPIIPISAHFNPLSPLID